MMSFSFLCMYTAMTSLTLSLGQYVSHTLHTHTHTIHNMSCDSILSLSITDGIALGSQVGSL